jgi:soluble lytic murein transglycosylase-like protein
MRCFEEASKKYGIDAKLLKAIAVVESGMDQKRVNRDRYGYSVGVMQVHSSWFPVLRRMGFDIERLKKDACYNIQVGAWILRQHIDEVKGNIWKGVARYNAKTKAKQLKYVKKVKLVLANGKKR